MGALNEPIQRLKVKKLGKRMWERNLELVKDFWTQIEQVTEGLALAYEKVRLYQDGLPVCGHELEIVTDLAKAGSRNYQLLLKLKEKGATLMGTESSELLLEEYQLVKQVFTGEMSSRAFRASDAGQRFAVFLAATPRPVHRPVASARPCWPAKPACSLSGCCTPWSPGSTRTSACFTRFARP